MDHLWRVIQEAAQASQPHQILFVFQLKADGIFRRLKQTNKQTKKSATSSKAELLASLRLTHLAGDLVDVVAVHQLGRDGERDQLAAGVVVFLSVPQLDKTRECSVNIQSRKASR